MKTLLALEFSTERRSVAVRLGNAVLAEAVQEAGRSSRIFPLMDEALRLAGVQKKSVGILAIGIGPGSYTGIRLAISAVQGWCLAFPDTEVWAISSFEIMAAEVSGKAWVVSDAQRQEWAVAEVDDGQVTRDARLISAEDLVRHAPSARILGPEVVQALRVGEAVYPKARVLAELALKRGRQMEPEQLEPVYLRAAAFVKAPTGRKILERGNCAERADGLQP